MKEDVPNRPDDISVEAWELAYDTNHALWAVCDDDPDDVKFWQDTKVIAHALLHARSQAFEEAAQIVDPIETGEWMSDHEKHAYDLRDVLSQAIRQHSQKGRGND